MSFTLAGMSALGLGPVLTFLSLTPRILEWLQDVCFEFIPTGCLWWKGMAGCGSRRVLRFADAQVVGAATVTAIVQAPTLFKFGSAFQNLNSLTIQTNDPAVQDASSTKKALIVDNMCLLINQPVSVGAVTIGRRRHSRR